MNKKELPSLLTQQLNVDGQTYTYYCLQRLQDIGMGEVPSLPFSIKILLEAAIRQFDGKYVTEKHIQSLAQWHTTQREKKEVPFKPARIVFQDYTGLPALVDLAALRNAVHKKGGNVETVNPKIPVDLVIDHSIIVEDSGHKESFHANLKMEYERNLERYQFVRWAQQSFANFRAVPPASGIVHQVNLEYLANSVMTQKTANGMEVYPDSLVGTDSHTPMINGLGTIGWGVGGIEAEAAMLGQPLYFVLPKVIGIKLKGNLPEGATATDLALNVTHLLRKKGVVGKFVEFFGPGLQHIPLADRATIANMAPEYGATMGFFPTDDVTLEYLKMTGRGEIVPLAEAYYKAQGLFRSEETPDPDFTEVVELDLATVTPALAGPKRPQDRVELSTLKQSFTEQLTTPVADGGFGLKHGRFDKKTNGPKKEIGIGDIVLASITSCTNTSNPSVMVAAGLLAKNAVKRGLTKPSFVKSSLTPGSRVVSQYLQEAGLLSYLEQLGFYVDGYGCAVCCGNSGPLGKEVEKTIKEKELVVASVLSGNRNFEGRIHPLIKANYLGSPPLVVAYALAGTVLIDLTKDPIGYDSFEKPVYLKDIWPTPVDVQQVITATVNKDLFQSQYQDIFENVHWNSIEAPEGKMYNWDQDSTYIQEPPYFKEKEKQKSYRDGIKNMKPLLILGDSITTDHISPAGQIGIHTPAGLYLTEKGVSPRDFNSYGSRRGNHEIMMRGTFANVRLNNKLADGKEGGYTKYLPTGEVIPVYDAAIKYKENHQNLLVIAGKEYGTGSSRDWAAKGTALLGVKVVLAESFERIHRSNLVGMGVLPLQFLDGENASKLGLCGNETYDVAADSNIAPGRKVKMEACKPNGSSIEFEVVVRIDSEVELEYYRHGGILQAITVTS